MDTLPSLDFKETMALIIVQGVSIFFAHIVIDRWQEKRKLNIKRRAKSLVSEKI